MLFIRTKFLINFLFELKIVKYSLIGAHAHPVDQLADHITKDLVLLLVLIFLPQEIQRKRLDG